MRIIFKQSPDGFHDSNDGTPLFSTSFNYRDPTPRHYALLRKMNLAGQYAGHAKRTLPFFGQITVRSLFVRVRPTAYVLPSRSTVDLPSARTCCQIEISVSPSALFEPLISWRRAGGL